MVNKQVRLLVVGSINMDLVMNIEKSPIAGETILGKNYSYIPGGKGANQAVAAARLGADVTFCGRVGNDANGNILIDNLIAEDINTSYTVRDNDNTTGLASIQVEANGQNRIIVFPGANYNITTEDVDQALEEDFDAVIMQLEIPINIIYYTFDKARAKGIPVVLDPAPAVNIDLARLKGLDIISPNESEAFLLTGIEVNSEVNAVKSASVLAKATEAKYVVIKLGDKGALLYENGRHVLIPGYRVKAIDSTAAGDSFTAAMTVKMLEGSNIETAIQYANAVGALCVSKEGAQPSLPTSKEVSDFISKIEILQGEKI
jgi:ribokinase